MSTHHKILMAMSGGIDSTVAALLLREQGYELIGVTFRTYDCMRDSEASGAKSCGSLNTLLEAQALAQKLGIEHHTLDLRDTFRQHVIGNFVDEYMHGRTPNPCVVCNSAIKWGKLWDMATELGCDKIATGHYAKIVEQDGHFYLAAAADTIKDQTYFLWQLTEENLAHTIFPLGDYTKTQVRAMAAERGFVQLAQKKESQEICFVPNNNYRDFLAHEVPNFEQVCCPGNFVDKNGTKIGTHEGFANYTIGQRRGLKVAFGSPRYVTKIDAEHNEVTLGEIDELFATHLYATKWHITDIEHQDKQIQAQIRYNSRPVDAKFSIENGLLRLDFINPVSSITPGQSVVLYAQNRVIGGGVIS